MSATSEPRRFHASRPTNLRTARPWHPLAHIVAALPATLERLAQDLDVQPGGRVLDYGSAEAPYRRLFPADVSYVAADLPGNPDADLELRPDGSVPLEAGSCDAVLSTQVLEHVEDPGLHLAECRRVLRPGGRLLLSTHGLMVYHPDPDDYWRWTGAGLRRVVEGAGLRVLRFEGVMGLAATGLQFVQDAAYPRVPARLRPALSLTLQSLARLADRVEDADAKRLNAMVFAVVAERP